MLALVPVALCHARPASADQKAGADNAPSAVQKMLAELNSGFTFDGRPVHPGLIEKFERWESDSPVPVVVAIDLLAAAGSNEFSDTVTVEDKARVTVTREGGQGFFGYIWLGTVSPGLHVVRTFSNGGGSGVFETLFVLRASVGTIRGPDGTSSQLLLSVVEFFTLGDRDDGTVTVRRNSITIGQSRYREKPVTLSFK